MKLHLVSLGCAKNLVDSEIMLGRLMQAGFTVTPDPGKANLILINTCSFIESAIDESIDTILELAKFKQSGVCERLIVNGTASGINMIWMVCKRQPCKTQCARNTKWHEWYQESHMMCRHPQ